MIPAINFAVRIISSTATSRGKVQAIEKISKLILSLRKYDVEFIRRNSDKIINVLRYMANQMRQQQYRSLDEILNNAATTFPGVVSLFSNIQEFKNFFLFIWNELSKTGFF